MRGGPGTGKTTIGLHFLTAGAAKGQKTLFISLGESETNIRANALSVGFDLEGISILDLTPRSEYFTEIQTYDIFSPAEVDREPLTRKIVDTVEELKPQRVSRRCHRVPLPYPGPVSVPQTDTVLSALSDREKGDRDGELRKLRLPTGR